MKIFRKTIGHLPPTVAVAGTVTLFYSGLVTFTEWRAVRHLNWWQQYDRTQKLQHLAEIAKDGAAMSAVAAGVMVMTSPQMAGVSINELLDRPRAA